MLELRRPDLARRERAANRLADHRAHIVDQRGLADEIWTPGKQAAIRDRCLTGRGLIRYWSGGSRARMVCRLASLDWTPLTAAGRIPAMVTLTYPGAWLEVAQDRAAVDRHLRMFYKQYERVWGEPLAGAWKFEFQRRGAPHVHIFMVPPHGFARAEDRARYEADLAVWEEAGRRELLRQIALGESWGQARRLAFRKIGPQPRWREAVGDFLPFRQWLSLTWAHIVNHQDPEQYTRHLAAGTGVDYAEGMRSADPKRLAVYFSKHGQFRSKDYQNRPPREWAGKSCGRFWGYRALRPATAVAELAPADYVAVTRTLRRWSRAQGVTRQVQAPRARGGKARPARRDVVGLAGAQLLDAHRVRRRTVRRRARYLHRGAGFVCVNDGPALARVLARVCE